MPLNRGVCGDSSSLFCTNDVNAVAAGAAIIIIGCTGWISRTPMRAILAAVLVASSMLKLFWGVPVVGDYFHSFEDLNMNAHNFRWLYTRQIYVPLELGLLNMGLYCIIRPYPPLAYAASAYWGTSVWLAVQYWNNAAAPLYTLHDVTGLFLGLVWFYAGPPSIRESRDHEPRDASEKS